MFVKKVSVQSWYSCNTLEEKMRNKGLSKSNLFNKFRAIKDKLLRTDVRVF